MRRAIVYPWASPRRSVWRTSMSSVPWSRSAPGRAAFRFSVMGLHQNVWWSIRRTRVRVGLRLLPFQQLTQESVVEEPLRIHALPVAVEGLQTIPAPGAKGGQEVRVEGSGVRAGPLGRIVEPVH